MSYKYSEQEQPSRRELQRFLDATIHNLRSPLRAIAIPAAMLREDANVNLDEQTTSRLKSILEGVARLDQLARSLADYSMALLPHDAAEIALPVGQALQTALGLLKKQILESGASVHSTPLPQLVASHEQLSVLFRCLISNALEYCSQAPRIEIDATQNGEEWRFTCRDNGIGIAPRYHKQVFEPYQRLQAGSRGVGLGLSICEKIVQAHGGHIALESQEGQGTTVIFTLPAN